MGFRVKDACRGSLTYNPVVPILTCLFTTSLELSSRARTLAVLAAGERGVSDGRGDSAFVLRAACWV